MSLRTHVVAAILFVFAPFVALAAEEAKGPEVKKVVLYPQALPRPALKHPLLPSAIEQNAGNAATLYMRAFLLQSQVVIDPEVRNKAGDWLDVPLDKFPRKEATDYLNRYWVVLDQLQAAALRENCDWGLPWREGDTPFAMLLPEAQAAREAARLLALKARLQMAEGKPLEALATLRAGYALARRVSEQNMLISSLIGVAISTVMNERQLELMQQPGAPNLFWSLAELPHPLVDIRQGLRFESAALQLTFNDAYRASRRKLTGAEADVAWNQFLTRWNHLGDMFGSNDPAWKKALERFAGPVTVPVYLPTARKNLAARGRSQKEIDDLPPAQAVLLDVFETYEETRDEQFKWFTLPFPEHRQKFAEIETKIKVARDSGNIGGALAGMLLPALHRASEAVVRGERRLGALICLEALRTYAQSHDGKLPASLTEIKDLPLPLNAVTGKPFTYRLEGEKAILLEDGLETARDRQYEITIAM